MAKMPANIYIRVNVKAVLDHTDGLDPDILVRAECDVCHEVASFRWGDVRDLDHTLVCPACEEAFDVPV